MNQDASYYIVIPGSVRADTRLNAEQKFLYGELAAKCNVTGYCWATNATLCEIVDCTERTLQRNLLELSRGNHIRIEIDRGGGKTTRKIWLVDSRDVRATQKTSPAPAIIDAPTRQNDVAPPANIGDNNTLREYSNKKKVSAPSRGPQEPKAEEKKPEPREHWQAMVDLWHFDYKQRKVEEPNFKGRNPAFFRQLYDLLRDRAKKKLKDWTLTHATGSLAYFLQIAYTDNWLKEHWLLENLVKQFDAVYAREATKGKPEGAEVKRQGRPASHEGHNAHLTYLVERYQEGNLDERIIEPDYFDRMVAVGVAQRDDFERYPGSTFEEKKIAAVKHWLTQFKKS